jgi:hypothetical protein
MIGRARATGADRDDLMVGGPWRRQTLPSHTPADKE